MGVFKVFYVVQMVPDRAKHHIYRSSKVRDSLGVTNGQFTWFNLTDINYAYLDTFTSTLRRFILRPTPSLIILKIIT